MQIPCSNWRDCGVIGGGCCAAAVYQRPSYGVCAIACRKYDGPDRQALARAVLANLSAGAPSKAQIGVPGGPGWTVDQPSRGLGDSFAKLTHAVGITPCGGCLDRQQGANDATPDWLKRLMYPGAAR